MKIGCISWSHRNEFTDDGLDIFKWMEHCKNDCHLDGVELWNNSFASLSDDYIMKIREKSEELALPVYSVATKCMFENFSESSIKGCVDTIGKWLKITNDLNASVMRISVAGNDLRKVEHQKLVFKTITEAIKTFQYPGIRVGIENQEPGVVQNSFDVNEMVKESGGLLYLVLDNGSFLDRKTSPYEFMENNLKYACVVHLKFFDINKDGSDNILDYDRIKDIITKSVYRGYLSIEYDSKRPATADVPLIADYLRRILGDV